MNSYVRGIRFEDQLSFCMLAYKPVYFLGQYIMESGLLFSFVQSNIYSRVPVGEKLTAKFVMISQGRSHTCSHRNVNTIKVQSPLFTCNRACTILLQLAFMCTTTFVVPEWNVCIHFYLQQEESLCSKIFLSEALTYCKLWSGCCTCPNVISYVKFC